MQNKRTYIISLLVVLLLAISGNLNAQRKAQRLTRNWEYVKGDLGGPYEALRTGREALLPVWEAVEMPHSFNRFDAVDFHQPYYQGPGWYRTHLSIDQVEEGRRLLLHFEGAGQKTKAFIGMQFVGEHVGGYDEFVFDITDAVGHYQQNPIEGIEAGKVPLIVRCDNSRDLELIPSDLSDFNLYGGLYRYVNLLSVPAVSFNQIHVDAQPAKGYKKATVSITPQLYNPFNFEGKFIVNYTILDPDGKTVASLKAEGNRTDALQSSVEIKKPRLWSVETPQLYTLHASLESENGTDEFTEKFGIRDFEFVAHGPFQLNGENLFLRGTHRHEDHAGYAAAMPEDLIVEEMQLMKAMGVNFIRLGHYQQSRIVLDACDSLGILVWEEIPWCRGGLGGENYKQQARRMLTNMINQHYNHPSVIIWGLGNENDWPGDFPEFDKEKIRTFMSELNDLSHSLDPVRKTAIRRCDFCADIIDVYSPSVWAGWYRGKYTEYTEVSKEWNEKVDHFLHVEWGASNHAMRHSEDPDKGLEAISTGDGTDERDGDFLLSGGEARVSKDGDWSETYACNLIDWHLKEQEKMHDWHVGTAYWPFKDFSTPLRPENPVPYVNQKGVVQRDFTKKEAFYVFQSYWTDEPMAHIYGHTWPVRWGAANESKMVKVYSNCEEAELFLNGRSLGVRNRNSQNFPAAGLRWIVQFNEGENHLKVIATKNGVQVSDEISQIYQTTEWKEPAVLKIEERKRIGNIVEIEAKIYDENNVFCPDAKNRIEFSLSGDGELLDQLGTHNGSNVIQLYNGRALIRVKMYGGKAIVAATSNHIKTGFITIEN
ncbi:glycoside hydrolase family 2 TIM barrel-domain containing protein [Roseimarinus sediminis]|uniref:glycoside hydrolase family 2 TIM barrel-domain containing protein n=1 Tax=Roseimarinus sediminis TaxID=1610899 RepID=UPI003D207CB3